MLLYIAFRFPQDAQSFQIWGLRRGWSGFRLTGSAGDFLHTGRYTRVADRPDVYCRHPGHLGYSINNTVIVFDRIRENMARGISPDIEVIANNSIVETLDGPSTQHHHTDNPAVLALFVGASIQNFVVVLIIGVISGTFTSTFFHPSCW